MKSFLQLPIVIRLMESIIVKESLKKVLILLVVIVAGFTLVACSSGDSLVGTWVSRGGGENRIIFLADGTGEQTNLRTGFTNEFRWTEGARIPFVLLEALGTELYEYEINGDTLILRRERSDGSEVELILRRE